MDDPTWHRHHLVLDPATAADLADALLVAGFSSVVRSSRPDGAEDLELYLAAGRPVPPPLTAVLTDFGLALGHASTHSERELLAGLLPGEAVPLAAGVVCLPPGVAAPEGAALVLHLPTAPAFGDGRHPTTRLAAGLVLGLGSLSGRRVLDLGCGTGVLGLLARARGAEEVVFSDADADAVRACRQACIANGVDAPVILAGDLLDALPARARFDLVIANLYGELLTAVLADPRLATLLPTGDLVLSGIAHDKTAAVDAALAQAGFAVDGRGADGWWRACRARREALPPG